ncbi:MAG: hypothetical protein DSM106950_37300 [Stigonema ocellatum SAG 48.90 = DSM 106950]|nr:hypothetical protein [Stigonema ocellatum SAG 48.90 = DSM 106950]
MKLTGMAGIGASVAGLSNLLLPEKAYGGCFKDSYGQLWCDPQTAWYYRYYQQQLQALYGPLLIAQVDELSLNRSHLPVFRPTSGTIILANESHQPSTGYLSLTVVDSKSLDNIEDQRTAQYNLPPRSANTVKFEEGPIGKIEGSKKFSAWTRKDNRSSPLTVYA